MPHNLELKAAFFEVGLFPAYWSFEKTREGYLSDARRAFRHAAVVDIEKESYFTIVGDTYCLVSNMQAFNLQRWIAKRLFNLVKDTDIVVQDVYLSNNRGSCLIDIFRKVDGFQPLANEGWSAFIRMRNSYNKTSSLSYQIGFAHRVKDRYNYSILIPDLTQELKTNHNGNPIKEIHEKIDKHLDKGDFDFIRDIEVAFMEKIQKLRGIYVDEEDMMPLVCKVLDYKKPNRDLSSEADILIEALGKLEDMIKRNINEHGKNAYSFLMLMADFVQQEYYEDGAQAFDGKQQKLGEWVDKLLKEKDKKGDAFEISDFIDSKYRSVCTWYRKRKDSRKE